MTGIRNNGKFKYLAMVEKFPPLPTQASWSMNLQQELMVETNIIDTTTIKSKYCDMGKISQFKRPREIKTPQALIHIKHKISLLQYKYWILMIRELRRQIDEGVQTDDKGFRTITMKSIEGALGYSPNKSELWNDLQALKNETIVYNVLEKDGGTMKKGSGFILEWGVTNHRIVFKLPSFIEDLVKGLDEPKAIFHALNWEIFNSISGKYQAYIYKLCRDFIGVGRTPYMEIEAFRDYMGIDTHEYKEFRDLNKWVISGPVKDINASDFSDLTIEIDWEKSGRKTLGLRFLVKHKHQAIMPFAEFEHNPAFRFAKITIDPQTQQRYLTQRGPEEIEKCIVRANEYAAQQEKAGKDVNYGAVYRKAISEGWHATIVDKETKAKQTASRKNATEAVLNAKEKEESKKNDEAQEKITEAFRVFAKLTEEQKDQIREDFRVTLKAAPLRKSFDKQGEEAPLVRSQFAEFFLSTYSPSPKKRRTNKKADPS